MPSLGSHNSTPCFGHWITALSDQFRADLFLLSTLKNLHKFLVRLCRHSITPAFHNCSDKKIQQIELWWAQWPSVLVPKAYITQFLAQACLGGEGSMRWGTIVHEYEFPQCKLHPDPCQHWTLDPLLTNHCYDCLTRRKEDQMHLETIGSHQAPCHSSLSMSFLSSSWPLPILEWWLSANPLCVPVLETVNFHSCLVRPKDILSWIWIHSSKSLVQRFKCLFCFLVRRRPTMNVFEVIPAFCTILLVVDLRYRSLSHSFGLICADFNAPFPSDA